MSENRHRQIYFVVWQVASIQNKLFIVLGVTNLMMTFQYTRKQNHRIIGKS